VATAVARVHNDINDNFDKPTTVATITTTMTTIGDRGDEELCEPVAAAGAQGLG